MRVGAVFPQAEIAADRGAVRAYIQGVSDLGFDHLTMYDLVAGPDRARYPDLPGYHHDDPFHELLVTLGYAAAIAPDLELVTAVVIAPQRQTALLAKQVAELDILTGGNFRCGLGVGLQEPQFQALGADFRRRGRRFDEQIEVLRRFWSDEVVDFHGEFHHIPGLGIAPAPTRRPIPLWIGGFSEVALRRAARVADGYFGYVPLEGGWPATIASLRQWVSEAGRDPGAFGIDVEINAGTDSPDACARAADEWITLDVSHISITTVGAGFTSPDQHLARLRDQKAMLDSKLS